MLDNEAGLFDPIDNIVVSKELVRFGWSQSSNVIEFELFNAFLINEDIFLLDIKELDDPDTPLLGKQFNLVLDDDSKLPI